MQVRGPSDIGLFEEAEERRREQQDGRWWTDWMCGCKESGGQGHGQVRRLSPGFTAADHCRLCTGGTDQPVRVISGIFTATYTPAYCSLLTIGLLYLRI